MPEAFIPFAVRRRPDDQRSEAGPWARVFLIWFLACFVLQPLCKAETELNESKVKALYLYNLVRYTEWPAGVFEQADSPIHLMIVASDRVAADLTSVVAGKLVQGRTIKVETTLSKPLAPKVHLLFVGEAEKLTMKGWLTETGIRPILTVAESDGFLGAGGMVSFHMDEGKVKLAVNLKPIKAAGLVLSSRLLAVATEVRGRE